MHRMPRSRKVRTATTETIPGLDYAVDRRMMTWGSGKSVGDAVEEMKDWAAEHDYDAIVGIQLESVADISSNIAGIVESTIYWVAYGTAIAFRPPHSQPSGPGSANADGEPA
jgi:hypothetical protein